MHIDYRSHSYRYGLTRKATYIKSSQKIYTNFKNGKTGIDIVILNLSRHHEVNMLSLLSNSHGSKAMCRKNILLQETVLSHFDKTTKNTFFISRTGYTFMGWTLYLNSRILLRR